MSIYDDLQGVVQGVMQEFNQGVIEYGAVTTGAGSVDEPGQSAVTYTTLTGATARGVKTSYVQSGLAVASDLQVTLAVQTGVTPKQKDFVKVDGVKYKVQAVVPKPVAGTPVAYVVIIRR